MSAWGIGLALSAAYLPGAKELKKLRIANKQIMDESIAEFQQSATKADPSLPSSKIRKVQRTMPPADRYQDMNLQYLDPRDADAIVKQRDRARAEVVAYESQASPPIQGVYLHLR